MNNISQDLQAQAQVAHSYAQSIAQAYSKLLDELIEDMILGMADGYSINLNRIHKFFEMEKSKIGFVHVIDLSLLQKLAYIRDRCRQQEICTLVDAEIQYWKHRLFYCITQTKQEAILYSFSKQSTLEPVEYNSKDKVTDEKSANGIKKKNSRKGGNSRA